MWAIVPLLCLEIATWIWLLGFAGLFRAGPNGKSLSGDFAVFLGAAQTLKSGGNPYNSRVLFHQEQALFHRQHLPVTSNRRTTRVGNPPLLYWVLEPLVGLPYRMVAFAWITVLLLLDALGFLVALLYLGWNHKVVPLISFLLMPQVAVGAAYGNVHAIVFAAIASALFLTRFPFASGLMLTAAWLKPQIALPIVLLVWLFLQPHRARLASGFSVGTVLFLVLSTATTGLNMQFFWLRGLTQWAPDVGAQPNLASLTGLLPTDASFGIRLILGVTLVALALGMTVAMLWKFGHRVPVPVICIGWLWGLWFLATPYAHFPDEIQITMPILAYLGCDGSHLAQRGPVFSLYAIFFSLIFFPTSVAGVNFLSLVLLAVVIAMGVATRARCAPSSDERQASQQ